MQGHGGVDLASKFVACAGQTSPIDGGPTLQLTGSADDLLVPDIIVFVELMSGWWDKGEGYTKIDKISLEWHHTCGFSPYS